MQKTDDAHIRPYLRVWSRCLSWRLIRIWTIRSTRQQSCAISGMCSITISATIRYNNTTWFFQLCIDIQLNDTATHEHSGDLLASPRQVLVSPSSLAYQKVWAFWTESPRSHENQLHWILATELDLWSPTIVRCHHLVVPVSFPGKLRTCCGPQSENKQNEPTCMEMIHVHQSNQRINPSFICSSDQTITTPFLL